MTVLEIKDFDISFNSDKMVLSDIGYKFKNLENFTDWLTLLNTQPDLALIQLRELPKQVRDKEWWNKFYNPLTKSETKKN